MIRPATKAIEAAFKECGVKHKILEVEDASVVEAGFRSESFAYEISFFSPDDETDVSVFVQLLHIPEAKRQAILPVLNQIHSEYRYFTFFMDEDGNVVAQFTFPVTTPMDSVGKLAVEMSVRSEIIFKEVYPKLMKVVWG